MLRKVYELGMIIAVIGTFANYRVGYQVGCSLFKMLRSFSGLQRNFNQHKVWFKVAPTELSRNTLIVGNFAARVDEEKLCRQRLFGSVNIIKEKNNLFVFFLRSNDIFNSRKNKRTFLRKSMSLKELYHKFTVQHNI